jgi:hypothetical protein
MFDQADGIGTKPIRGRIRYRLGWAGFGPSGWDSRTTRLRNLGIKPESRPDPEDACLGSTVRRERYRLVRSWILEAFCASA